jgi:methyl-accepting chemotaxis protein
MFFNNLKVGQKLAVAFGLCLLMAVGAELFALNRLTLIDSACDDVTHGIMPQTDAANLIAHDMHQFRIEQLKEFLSVTKADVDAQVPIADAAMAKVNADIDAYATKATDLQDKANLDKVKTAWGAYISDDSKTDAIAKSTDRKAALAFVNGESKTAFTLALDSATALAKWNDDTASRLSLVEDSQFKSGKSMLTLLIIVQTLLSVAFALYVTRLIVGSLNQVNRRLKSLDEVCINNLQTSMNAMAGGDLTVAVVTGTEPLKADTSDEFGDLARSVNGIIGKTQSTVASYENAQASLSKLVGETRRSALSITSTSAQIAAGNEDLSQRTAEQASSLEETAASMEEMTSIVKQSADNARDANKQAVEARTVAEDGGAIVAKAVESMQSINSASRQINDIISVIDEIAFQTNLLALNAAVEAARVGEQGRGFAVVASEVRNLAGRSSTAAKEIKALVTDTVRKVEDGTKLVNQSGEQLKNIVSAITDVSDKVAEISSASQEQAAGIEQVNKAVVQMDEITQQNAALVEEATAASQSMSHQAQDLQILVQKFKVSDEEAASGVRIEEVRAAKSPKAPVKMVAVNAPKRRPTLALLSTTQDHDMEEF